MHAPKRDMFSFSVIISTGACAVCLSIAFNCSDADSAMMTTSTFLASAAVILLILYDTLLLTFFENSRFNSSSRGLLPTMPT